jgi:sialate O-acetylesterase
MINPLLPYALRGALWYQGESNAERANEYRALFGAMITSWRAHFGQGDFPFYWVSLANYGVPPDATGLTYAFLREAQTQTLALPNTGQALAIDIGDPNNIHPANKQDVGHRLALLARNRVYGLIGDDTGPVFASATREGAALRVKFEHASSLVAHDKEVQALEVAGADRRFFPATGKIERGTLLVSAREVREPVAVRYAWTNAPAANLYNGAGLPAVPFRSDNW